MTFGGLTSFDASITIIGWFACETLLLKSIALLLDTVLLSAKLKFIYERNAISRFRVNSLYIQSFS